MARTYGALGPRGDSPDPQFIRALALAALANRRGPSGSSQPPQAGNEFDFITNPLAKDRYARSFLDEKLRGMIAEREQTHAQPRLAQGALDLQGRSFEDQVRQEMAQNALGQQRLSQEGELGRGNLDVARQGVDLGYQQNALAWQQATDTREMGGRALEEQIRAAHAMEALKGRELDITANPPVDPAKALEAKASEGNYRINVGQQIDAWLTDDVKDEIVKRLIDRDVHGAVDYIRTQNPMGESLPAEQVKRIIATIIQDPDTQEKFLPFMVRAPYSGVARQINQWIAGGYRDREKAKNKAAFEEALGRELAPR